MEEKRQKMLSSFWLELISKPSSASLEKGGPSRGGACGWCRQEENRTRSSPSSGGGPVPEMRAKIKIHAQDLFLEH